MLATIVISGGSFWAMEVLYRRNAAWFLREPHLPVLMRRFSSRRSGAYGW